MLHRPVELAPFKFYAQPDCRVKLRSAIRDAPLNTHNVRNRVLIPACAQAGILAVRWHNFRYTGTVKLSRICPFCEKILLDQRLRINDLAVAAGGENAAKLLDSTLMVDEIGVDDFGGQAAFLQRDLVGEVAHREVVFGDDEAFFNLPEAAVAGQTPRREPCRAD